MQRSNTTQHVTNTTAPSSPFWQRTVAGGLAGATARSVVSPFDVIKIRWQVLPRRESVMEFLRSHGVTGLWRGNVSGVLLWTTYTAVQFPVYHAVKEVLSPLPPTVTAMVSGGVAGVAATIVSQPFDRIRTLSVATPSKLIRSPQMEPIYTLRAVVQHIRDTAGWRGFYIGLAPACTQVAPYIGIVFAVYEALEPFASADSTVSASQRGAVAGCVAKLAVYPLDTVRRRVHMQSVSGFEMYRTSFHVMRCILEQESVASLYRGVVPSVLKSSVGPTLSFALFDVYMRLLQPPIADAL